MSLYSIDPIDILLRVAENGFAEDLQACGLFISNFELWSHLVKARVRGKEHWLAAATALGHVDRVKFLLSVGALRHSPPGAIIRSRRWALNVGSSDGNSLLGVACRTGNPDIVRLLLTDKDSGYDFNNDGYSPLHTAVFGGHLEIVKLLLGRTARFPVNLRASDVRPLGFGGHVNSESPLHVACMCYDADLRGEVDYIGIVEALLDAGADAACATRFGETPLHYISREFGTAASIGEQRAAIARLLIARGAPLDASTFYEREICTAMAHSTWGGYDFGEVLAVLLEAGAATHDCLKWSIRLGNPTVVAALLDHFSAKPKKDRPILDSAHWAAAESCYRQEHCIYILDMLYLYSFDVQREHIAIRTITECLNWVLDWGEGRKTFYDWVVDLEWFADLEPRDYGSEDDEPVVELWDYSQSDTDARSDEGDESDADDENNGAGDDSSDDSFVPDGAMEG